MVDPAAQPPVADGESNPVSVKQASKSLTRAFRAYRSAVDGARRRCEQAERDYTNALRSAEQEREKAAQPRKLGSVGVLRSVVLTETTIKTPKGTFPLTPSVEARAEQHGNKQVVQGWVFKSDNDRREVYLHLTGPDWADVVPFALKHSSVEPRHVHQFAAKVGVAARGSNQARAAVRARVAAVDERLRAIRNDRSQLVEAARSWVAAARDLGGR
jgi:hypothetical protein